MATTRMTFWYLEPLDPHTNHLIAQHLPEENACYEQECADGMRHDLWQCEHSYITRMTRATGELKLHFRVWFRHGSGPICQWPFERSSAECVSSTFV